MGKGESHKIVEEFFARRFATLEHDADNLMGVMKTFLCSSQENRTLTFTRNDVDVLVSYITNLRIQNAFAKEKLEEPRNG